jgi:hypothetical protein
MIPKIPLAFAIASGMAMAILFKKSSVQTNKSKWRERSLISLLGISAAIGLWWFFPFIAGAICLLFVGFFSAVARRKGISGGSALLLAAVAMVIVSYAEGFDISRSYLAGPPAHRINLNNQEVREVKIMRSGDRGVMLYDPTERRVNLLRWDQIQQISRSQ